MSRVIDYIEWSADESFMEGIEEIMDSSLSDHDKCLEIRLLVLEIYGNEEITAMEE